MSDISNLEKYLLSVANVISKNHFPVGNVITPIALMNKKYPDQRLVRYFLKKYYNIDVGKYSYGVIHVLETNHHTLKSVGSFTSIARNFVLSGYNHPVHMFTTHPLTYESRYGFIEDKLKIGRLHPKNKQITIGNDVWIGTNVTILPSVHISDGAIIGAGSVVTKDIPPYAIAVGVPANVIKYRFSQHIIDMLLKSQWWAWEDSRLKELCKGLYYLDLNKVHKYDETYVENKISEYLVGE